MSIIENTANGSNKTTLPTSFFGFIELKHFNSPLKTKS